MLYQNIGAKIQISIFKWYFIYLANSNTYRCAELILIIQKVTLKYDMSIKLISKNYIEIHKEFKNVTVLRFDSNYL